MSKKYDNNLVNEYLKKFDDQLLTFHQESFFKAMGFTHDEIQRPRIAIVNSWSEQSPAHVHLRELAEAVKAGVRNYGGMPFEINVIGPCGSFGVTTDEISHYDFPTRDVILTSIETALRQGKCDGWIGLASCDKIVPAMLMAAARLDRPCVIVPGGSMLPGNYKGEWVTTGLGTDIFFKKYPDGNVDPDDFDVMTSACGYCPGTCAELTTGVTMQMLSEALGMSVPYSSTVPSVIAQTKHLAKLAGQKILELAEKGIKPSDIITVDSMRNAIKLNMAVCGSTNTVIHLQGLAHELGLPITLDTWNEISEEVYPICSISRTGEYSICDLHYAGGVPAVLKEISDTLDLDSMTVTGETVAKNIEKAKVTDRRVIHEKDDPLFKLGAIKVLKGNIAPEGAVVRQSVISNRDLLVADFNARVFDSHHEALGAVLQGDIKPMDAIVLKYEGPRGGPAMTELYFVVTAVKKMGLTNIAIITDGRFSGNTQGMVAIGHVAPEAYVGGPMAFIENGDTIHIDIPEGKMDLLVSDEVLAQRKSEWTVPDKPIQKGVLAVYRNFALQAYDGAGWQLD